MENLNKNSDKWLDIKLDDIPDPLDKLLECKYFFRLLEVEVERDNFRWLMSAFLSAAYSFFETANFYAQKRYSDEVSSVDVGCEEMLGILKNYVFLREKGKGDKRFSTSGMMPLIKQLYDLRHLNTHRSAFSIKTNGVNLPGDFVIGFVASDDVSAIEFCKKIITIMENVSDRLREVF